jgi:uncharacterized protein
MIDRGMLGGLHPFIKLLALALLMLVSLLVVFFLGMLAALPFTGFKIFEEMAGAAGGSLNMLRYIQIISHLGLFIVPGLVFAFLVGRNPLNYLQGQRLPRLINLLIPALIITAVVPVVYTLMQLNQQLSLPGALSGLEQWMRQTEDAAEAMIEQFLNVSGMGALLFNLLMIAVLPAIGEEFIFRGALQRIFRQWTGNVHLAVFIAAILFSALHLQFFGFLPRLLLGLLLGYMFVMTKNIWVPVFAHFFNNAAAVIMYYIAYNTDVISLEDMTGNRFSLLIIIFSVWVTSMLFWAMKRFNKKPG